MDVRIATAVGSQLNLMVALAKGASLEFEPKSVLWILLWPPATLGGKPRWSAKAADYCQDWNVAGPLYEPMKQDVKWNPAKDQCFVSMSTIWPSEFPCGLRAVWAVGQTELIARARCFVSSVYAGGVVSLPKDLA